MMVRGKKARSTIQPQLTDNEAVRVSRFKAAVRKIVRAQFGRPEGLIGSLVGSRIMSYEEFLRYLKPIQKDT